jgi:hypothetical protein
MREAIVQPWVRRSILARYRSPPEVRQHPVPTTVKGRFMEKLSAEDALEARRLADQLGLRKLSDQDLVKLLNAARVANMRRDALDTSGLSPADEPALVFRLPATGQSL